jgi:hypothetical protein
MGCMIRLCFIVKSNSIVPEISEDISRRVFLVVINLVCLLIFVYKDTGSI